MINKLIPEMQHRVEALLFECEENGVIMTPYYGIRPPLAQAKLWRQSRTSAEIRAQIARLRNAGAYFLAHCLHSAGPQHGRWATNALPGMSWHQWREAVDCFWNVDGAACWDADAEIGGKNGYRVYAAAAQKSGLVSLGPAIGDWVHVQLRAGVPLTYMSLPEIDAVMKERYEEK